MKIAALTIDYPPRRFIGSEMATHAMLKHLNSIHDVQVFTTTPGAPYSHEGIPVTPGVRAFRQHASEADLIVSHVEFGKWMRGVNAPCVGITHNARHPNDRHVASTVWDLIVHNADTTASELAANRRAPYIVVHPPVDWRHYNVARPAAEWITLVNVTGEKGSDTFYELARRLPDHRFLGVIGGWGQPDVRDLPNVQLVEHTEDMRRLYACTRILLMASEHESWGRVAVEAMASGIPVVATDLPGPREAIGDGGFLVELNWWDEFERIIRLLDDPAVYADTSLRASARARELDPAAELDVFTECVEALAAGRRGPWHESTLEV